MALQVESEKEMNQQIGNGDEIKTKNMKTK